MSARLKVSRAGIDLLKAFEGFRRRAARLPDGRWTVGYGHTLSAREGAEVSEADAEALLIFDLLPIADAVEATVRTPLNQNQFDALVAFAFNVGLDAFRSSKVLEHVDAGRLTEAAMALDAWRNAELNGRTVPLDPLVRRRAAEKALFLAPPGGLFSVPSALVRPAPDARAEAAVPTRGLADVEIPFDGPFAGVRVVALPEPEPEPEPAPAPVLGPDASRASRTAEPSASVSESIAPPSAVTPANATDAEVPGPAAAPAGAAPTQPAPPSPGWRPNGLPSVQPASAFGSNAAVRPTAPASRPASPRPAAAMQLYAPYASMAHGPLPIGRPAPREARSAPAAGRDTLDSEPAPAPAARAPEALSTPGPVPAPVVAGPLQLPPRPAEPRSFLPERPDLGATPQNTTEATPSAPGPAAEPLVLTPPPEHVPVSTVGAPEDAGSAPGFGADEPALFEDQSPRIVRHEVVAAEARDGADETGSGDGRVWWLIAAVGVVVSSGALAAYLRRDTFYGSDAVLGDPTTLAWIMAVVGAACLTTSAYFLLKRVGGVKD